MNELRFLNQIAEALDRIADAQQKMAQDSARLLEIQEITLKLLEVRHSAADETDQLDEASR